MPFEEKMSYLLHPVVLRHIHLTSYALLPKPFSSRLKLTTNVAFLSKNPVDAITVLVFCDFLKSTQNINNIRYADDTVLIADSAENLQSLLNTVVAKSAEYGLTINTA